MNHEFMEVHVGGDSDSFLNDIDRAAKHFVKTRMKEVDAEDIGLDSRASYQIYVDETHIAIPKSDDRTMQYYGGFEYVDREYRSEVGDYVFYSAEDRRVRNHLSRVIDSVKGDDDEEFD